MGKTHMEWVREEAALEKCVKAGLRFKNVEKHIRDEREGVPAGKRKPQHKTCLRNVRVLSMGIWEA